LPVERKRSLALVVPAYIALCTAATGASGTARDHGVLQRFVPRTPSTWWAIVASNLTQKTFIARATDGGRHWRSVQPPVELVSSSSFLGRRSAWVEAGAPAPSRTEVVYRTLDGGGTWRRLGRVQSECQLDFVDVHHGWCTAIGAATGSETVALYRTTDGGSSWRLVSRSGLPGTGSTPGALPYACDKTISFTSPRVGWAATYCNGGVPRLYTTTNGGAGWHAPAPVPLPRGLTTRPAGEGLSLPAVTGSQPALTVDIGGTPRGATAIATSTDGRRSWNTRLVPGLFRYWMVDLIDVRHWRLSDGTTMLATDDIGRHWRSWKPPWP
jgi:photosystem II stability/assembly factor-like uncharacterized protein